jgi:hypothetical protein
MAGGDKIKIGKSQGVTERLRTIQSMSPVPLKMIGYVVGYTMTERALHKRFADHRAHGEWFRSAPEISSWLEQNREKPVIGLEHLRVDPDMGPALQRVERVLALIAELYP